jgi:hypothetical protein
MIKLMAASREDGWGIVQDGQRVLLLRPPYGRANVQQINEKFVERAAVAYGFTVVDREFPDLRSVLLFLDEQVKEARAAIGQDLDIKRIQDELMSVAPPAVMRRFLLKIENELLPDHLYENAQSMLMAMLDASAVRQDADLGDAVISLLRRARDEQKLWERSVCQQRGLDGLVMRDTFPLASSRHGEGKISRARNDVMARGQVFAIVG